VLAVVGYGCVELRRELCALCEGESNSNLHTMHTAHDAAPHNHSQYNQCRTPYAVVHDLVLLMMGIIMSETCWDRSLIINIGLVASSWSLSLSLSLSLPYVHDARSQEPKRRYLSKNWGGDVVNTQYMYEYSLFSNLNSVTWCFCKAENRDSSARRIEKFNIK